MQSGISASQELVSQFNTLLSSDQHFGLLATITGESLTPLSLLDGSTAPSSFGANLDRLVVPALQPTEALYVILKRYADSPRLIAATYVPDTAKVRQKMLFASTRLTLVRELGREHFRDTFLVTTPAELTADGFKRHDAHAQLDAPLTEEERSLGEVKRAEQEAGSGTASRQIHLSSHMAVPFEDDALQALEELKEGGGRSLLFLKINPETEQIVLADTPSTVPSSISALSSAISTTEPRFTFYRYTHTHNGSESSPLLFVYTCPMTPGTKAIKFRMMYPLMKRALLEVATSKVGLTVDKKFEVEDPSEVTEEVVHAELHPKVESKAAFSRPKRPGR